MLKLVQASTLEKAYKNFQHLTAHVHVEAAFEVLVPKEPSISDTAHIEGLKSDVVLAEPLQMAPFGDHSSRYNL